MTFTVNGVNLLPYLAAEGLKWQRNDLDAPDAGRTLDGVMHRSRIASKVTLEITCRPLNTSEASIVLQAIYPEFVTVRYDDPQTGGIAIKTMYSNNNPATFAQQQTDGSYLWKGITFPLIEQ